MTSAWTSDDALRFHLRGPIDRLLAAQGWPTSEGDAMGELLRQLSEAYNRSEAEAFPLLPEKLLAPRFAFSFLRDLPKSKVAVRELLAKDLLPVPQDRPLRILDIGAGLGATTWGILDGLLERNGTGKVESLLLDQDRRALDLGAQLVRAAGSFRGIDLAVETTTASLGALFASRPAPFDLVLLGQVLSELDRGRDESTRATAHADLVRRLLRQLVAETGSLVVVEPALRERTRHLHRVRDGLRVHDDVTIFAPCPHRAACPMMVSPHDWCHEDVPIDLPPWLVPVARAAGLRWQGLTFSYLVLRRDGKTLAEPGPPSALRVVAAPKATKGKLELALCGDPAAFPGAMGTGPLVGRLLDRDTSELNRAMTEAARGDVLGIDARNTENSLRVRADTTVSVLKKG